MREAWPGSGTEFTVGRLDGDERLELTVTSDALVVFSDGGETDRLTAVRGQRVQSACRPGGSAWSSPVVASSVFCLQEPGEQPGECGPLGRIEVGEQRLTGLAGDALGAVEDLTALVGQLNCAQPPVAGHGSAHRKLPGLEVVNDPHHRHPVAPDALDQVALGARPVVGENREHTEVTALDPERSQRLTESAGGPGVGPSQQLAHGVRRKPSGFDAAITAITLAQTKLLHL